MRIFVILFAFFYIGFALAQMIDPMTGTRVSLASTQALLATLPLPSLEAGSKRGWTPQVSYQTALINEKQTATSAPADGTFSGGAVGLGYVRPRGRVGYFGIALVNHMTGSIDFHDSGGTTSKLRDFSTQGIAAAIGANYRFWGEANSRYAAGIFAGPAFMSYLTEFKLGTDKYTTQPNTYGALVGIQAKARIKRVLFNPYVLYFDDKSDSCKSFRLNGKTVTGGCGPSGKEVNLKGTFWAYGLILGYGRFKLNVYSDVSNHSNMDNIELHTTTLTYTFE